MSGDASPIGHPVSITLVNGAVRTGIVFTYSPDNNSLVLLTPTSSNNNSDKNNNNNNKDNKDNNNNSGGGQWGFSVVNTSFIKSISRPTNNNNINYNNMPLPPSLAPGVQLPDLPTDDKLLTGKMKENIDKAIERRAKLMPHNNNNNNTNDNNNTNSGNNNNSNNNNTMPVLALALYLQLSRTFGGAVSRWDWAEECIVIASTPLSHIHHDAAWRAAQAPKVVWRAQPEAHVAQRQQFMVEEAWAKVTAQCEALSSQPAPPPSNNNNNKKEGK